MFVVQYLFFYQLLAFVVPFLNKKTLFYPLLDLIGIFLFLTLT